MKFSINPVDLAEALGEELEKLNISGWFNSPAPQVTAVVNSTVAAPATDVCLAEGFTSEDICLDTEQPFDLMNNALSQNVTTFINNTAEVITQNITMPSNNTLTAIVEGVSSMDPTTVGVGAAAVLGGLGVIFRTAGKNGIDLSKFYQELEKTAEGKQLATLIKNVAKGQSEVVLSKLTPAQQELIKKHANTLYKLGEGVFKYLLNPNKNKVTDEKLAKLATFKTPEELATVLPNFADALKTSLKLQKLLQSELSEPVVTYFKGLSANEIAELTKALDATHNNVISNFNSQRTDEDKINYIKGVVKGTKVDKEVTGGLFNYFSSFFTSTKNPGTVVATNKSSSKVEAPAPATNGSGAPLASEDAPANDTGVATQASTAQTGVMPSQVAAAPAQANTQQSAVVMATQAAVDSEAPAPSIVNAPLAQQSKEEAPTHDEGADDIDFSDIVFDVKAKQRQMNQYLTAYYSAYPDRKPKLAFAQFTATAQIGFVKELKLTDDGHLTQESVNLLKKMDMLKVDGKKASLKV